LTIIKIRSNIAKYCLRYFQLIVKDVDKILEGFWAKCWSFCLDEPMSYISVKL